MSDIMSVIASAYASQPLMPATTKYTPVDATYEGTWQGTYSNNQKFQISITDVNGFRAQVKYQSDGITQYQQVLIGNSSFRVGNSKFVLTGTGKAQVYNAVTDPTTGNTSLVQGSATLDT
jgi:hypothetical protein